MNRTRVTTSFTNDVLIITADDRTNKMAKKVL